MSNWLQTIISAILLIIFPVVPSVPKYFYPISNYQQRLMAKHFGQLVKPEDSKNFVCGAAFSGYHTGDDLEIFPGENEVPVYAVTDGEIIQKSLVSGYGGLMIIKTNIENQPVTVYYGHINIDSATSSAIVSAGQKIAVLGNACSSQTGFERKHLHFAIHKGENSDLRGYVNSPEELSTWLDPSETLQQKSL